VIIAYWRAYQAGDQIAAANALKWFRGEYSSRREAKEALGIQVIPTDDTWYDHLKILASFLVSAGYRGLLIIVDELVNIFKISHSVTRQNNYEKLLTMYNDALQGKARHIGFFLGCTPQAMEDRYKGLFSYEALRSRLAASRFAGTGEGDLTAPMIRLEALTQEEMYVLTEKLRDIHAGLYDYAPTLRHEDLLLFLEAEYNRVGADTHITPREIIRDFLEVTNLLAQNPAQSLPELLRSGGFQMAKGGLPGEDPDGAGLADFAEFEV
jgi:hypothetical protein